MVGYCNKISKGTKIKKKFPEKRRRIMKIRVIEVIKPKIRKKTSQQMQFSCSKKIGLVVTETDLPFRK